MGIIRAGASLDIGGFVSGLQQMVSQTNSAVAGIQSRLQNLEQSGNRAFASVAAQSKVAAQGISADFSVLSNAEKDLLRVSTAFNGLFRQFTQLSSVGKTIGIMGAAIEAVGIAAIKSGEDFDFWTRRVLAASEVANRMSGNLSGMTVDAPAQANNLQLIRDGVESIGRVVGIFKPEEIAKGFYLWTSATGQTVRTMEDLQKVLPNVEHMIQAAGIAGVDVETVFRGVAGAVQEFGLDIATYGAHVTNLLLNVTQVTGAEFSDIIGAIRMVGPIARAAGLSIEEVIAVLGKLADANIRGTNAGRGLSRMLESFLNPSDKAQAALNYIFQATGKGADTWRNAIYPGGQFVGILDKINERGEKTPGLVTLLADATRNMGESERAALLSRLGTENADREVIALVNTQLAQETRLAELMQQRTALQEKATAGDAEAAKELEKVNGQITELNYKLGGQLLNDLKDGILQQELFGKQWNIIADSMKNQFGIQMNIITGGLRELGVVAQGALIPLLTNVGHVVDAIRIWVRENKELTQNIVTIVAVAGSLLIVLGGLMFAIGQLGQIYTIIHQTMAAFGAGIAVVANMGILFGVLTVAALGVVAALAYVRQSSEETWATLVFTLRSALQGAIATMADVADNLIKMVQAITQGNWQKAWLHFQNVVVDIVAYIVYYIPHLFNLLFGGIGEVIDAHTGGLLTRMRIWGENIVAQLGLGILQGAIFVAKAVAFVTSLISKMWEGHSPPKEGPLKGIREWGQKLVESFSEGIIDADQEVDHAATHTAKKLAEKLEGHSPAKSGPLSKIDQWGQGIAKAYASGFHNSEDEAATAADHIGKVLAKRLEGHSPAQEGEMSDIHTWGIGIAQAYTSGMRDEMVRGAHTVAQDVAETLKSDLEAQVPQKLSESQIRVYEAGRTFMDGLLNSFRKADFGTLNEIMSTVSKRLEEEFTKATDELDTKTAAGRGAKLNLAERLFGDQTSARQEIAQTIGSMNSSVDSLFTTFNGLDNIQDRIHAFQAAVKEAMDTSPVDRLSALVKDSTIGDDLKNMVGALADVDAVQKFKQAIDDTINQAQEIRNGHQEEINALQQIIALHRREKEPIQETIDALKERIGLYNDEKQRNIDSIQANKDELTRINEVRDGIRNQIADVNDKIAAERDAIQPIQEQIDAQNQIKTGIQEEITAIKARYDAERKADDDKLKAIDLSIEKQRAMNNEMDVAAQHAIAAAKQSGVPLAVITNMERQLQLAKEKQTLDLADMDVQKQKQDISNKERDVIRTSSQNNEMGAAEKRLQAVDKDIKRLETEKKIHDDRIKQSEKDLRQLEAQDRVQAKAQRTEEEAVKRVERDNARLDREIEKITRDEALEQRKIDRIEKEAQLAEKNQLRPLEDEIKAEDLKIKGLEARRKVIEVELAAAQERLDIEKSISQEHLNAIAEGLKLERERSASTKEDKPIDPFAGTAANPSKGSLFDPDKIKADVEAAAAQFKESIDKMLKPFKDAPLELAVSRLSIQLEFNKLFSDLKTVWSQAKSDTDQGSTDFAKRLDLAFTTISLVLHNFQTGDYARGIEGLRMLWMEEFGPVGEAIGLFFDNMGNTINTAFDKMITDYFGNDKGTLIIDAISKIFTVTGEIGASVRDGLISFVTGFWSTLGEIIADPSKVKELPDRIYDAIKSAIDNVRTRIGPLISKLGDDIRGSFTTSSSPAPTLRPDPSRTVTIAKGTPVEDVVTIPGARSRTPAFETTVPSGEVPKNLDKIGEAFDKVGRALDAAGKIIDDVGPQLAKVFDLLGNSITNLQRVLEIIHFEGFIAILAAIGGYIFVGPVLLGIADGLLALGGALGAAGGVAGGLAAVSGALQTNILLWLAFGGYVTIVGAALAIVAAALAIMVTTNPGPIIGPWAEFMGILAFISAALGNAITNALVNLAPLWARMTESLGTASIEIGKFLVNIQPLILILGAVLSGVLQGVVQGLGTLLIGALEIAGGAIQVIVSTLNLLMETFGLVFGVVGNFKDILMALAHGDLPAAGAAFKHLGDFVGEQFGRMFESVGGIVHGLGTIIEGVFTATVGTVIALIGGFVQGIIGFFKNLYDQLVGHSIIPELMDAIVGFFTGLWDRISGAVGAFVKGVVDGFGGIMDQVRPKLQEIIDNCISFFTTTAPAIGSQLLTSLYEGASSYWNDHLLPWIQGLVGLITGQFDVAKILLALKDAGVALIQGFWNGLMEKWKDVEQWINDHLHITIATPTVQTPSQPGGNITIDPNLPSYDGPANMPHADGGVLTQPIFGRDSSGRTHSFAENGPEVVLNRIASGRIVEFIQQANLAVAQMNNAGRMNTPMAVPQQIVTYEDHYHVGTIIATDADFRALNKRMRPYQDAEQGRRLS